MNDDIKKHSVDKPEMKTIIIRYDENLDPKQVVDKIGIVITEGMISKSAGRPHYCWVTTFHDMSIHTTRKRKDDSADSFVVIPN